MKRWRLALLLLELVLFALILVLPQVDLPDFTFPGGTAPIVAKARLSASPTFTDLPAPVHVRSFLHDSQKSTRAIWLAAHLNTTSLFVIDCILRC